MLTMCAQYAGSRWLAVLLSDFGKPEIGPVAPFYFTMSCSLMTDRLSVHGDPLRRKHSHAPVRAVRKCLYVEIRGKVVGRTHHRRWGCDDHQPRAFTGPVDVPMTVHENQATGPAPQSTNK